MTGRIRILHVDDEPDFAGLVATYLEREDDRFEVETATSPRDGLATLADATFDCVVSDYDMPGMDGIAFLERVRETHSDLPFILFTGKGSEEVASDAISSGVTDYLQKETGTDQYTVLANRIVNAVDAHEAETDLARRSRQNSAVADLSREAIEGLDPQSLAERAVAVVAELLGTDSATLLELADDGERLRLVAGTGWDEGAVGAATVGTETDSQAGYTLSVSEPVVVEDLPSDDRFDGPQLLADHDVVSGISVVVGSRTDPYGVLGTHATDRRSFAPADVQFVQNIANVLGSAFERHRTDRRRRESERRFREIAELSPDTIFRLDPEGTFTYVSPAVESLLGYDPDDLLGTPFQEYVHEESLSAAVEGYTRVREGAVVRDLAVTLVDSEGSPVEVELSASPVHHDGEVTFVQGFTRELTGRTDRERDREQSREHTDRILDGIADLLFIHDETGTLQRWNESFAAVTGYSEEALATMRGVDFVPEKHRDRTAAAIRDVFETGEARLQAPLVTADGSEIPYEFVANRVTHPDGTRQLVGIGREITDRKEREREHERLEARYRTLVDNVPNGGIFLFDEELRYTIAGGDELSAVGLTSAAFEGSTPHDLFPDSTAEELAGYYREALAGREHTFEQTYQNGVYRIHTVPVRNDAGEVVAGLAISQNVTEQRARRRELERQNDQLERFASVISHDLRNPLSVAEGNLELAREECDSEHLDRVETALDRSQVLLADLLALAKSGRQVSDPAPVGLRDVIEQAWANVSTDGARLAVEVAPDRTILADETRVKQCLENLFRNCVEHGSTGSRPAADADAGDDGGPDPQVTVGSLADGFYVADDGPGIPREDRDRVFDPGYSTAEDGTGFGLSIVAEIVAAHGWEIAVTDAADGGVRFEITGVDAPT